MNKSDIFPKVVRSDTLKGYVKRGMLFGNIPDYYPNRKERKKALIAHFNSVDKYERHLWYDPDKYLKRIPAAEYLGISLVTFFRWSKDGLIKPVRMKLGRKFVNLYDIEGLEIIKRLRDEIKREKQKSDSD